MWRPLQRHGHGVVRAHARRPVRTLRAKVQAQDGPYDCYAACKSRVSSPLDKSLSLDTAP